MKPDTVLGPEAPAGLVVRDLVVHRGGSQIVNGVDLSAPPGEVTVLLGPNGAGKTTLLEALSGRIPASRGIVRIGGQDVLRSTRVARAHLGLAHVEQGRTVFRDLTVEENLRVAAHTGDLDDAYTLFPELRPRSRVAAGALSGGEQQLLVLARAMLGRPGAAHRRDEPRPGPGGRAAAAARGEHAGRAGRRGAAGRAVRGDGAVDRHDGDGVVPRADRAAQPCGRAAPSDRSPPSGVPRRRRPANLQPSHRRPSETPEKELA